MLASPDQKFRLCCLYGSVSQTAQLTGKNEMHLLNQNWIFYWFFWGGFWVCFVCLFVWGFCLFFGGVVCFGLVFGCCCFLGGYFVAVINLAVFGVFFLTLITCQ